MQNLFSSFARGVFVESNPLKAFLSWPSTFLFKKSVLHFNKSIRFGSGWKKRA